MALSKTRLRDALKTQLEAYWGGATDSAWLTEFCTVLADCVVDEIISHAVVTGSTSTPSVQTGGSTAAGTFTGTVTS